MMAIVILQSSIYTKSMTVTYITTQFFMLVRGKLGRILGPVLVHLTNLFGLFENGSCDTAF